MFFIRAMKDKSEVPEQRIVFHQGDERQKGVAHAAKCLSSEL